MSMVNKLVKLLKGILPMLEDALKGKDAETTTYVRKWGKGKVGLATFVTFSEETKDKASEVLLWTPSEEEVGKFPGIFTSGILSRLIDGCVMVDNSFLPETMKYMKPGDDPASFVAEGKGLLAHTLARVESELNVWILPTDAGTTMRVDGGEFTKFLFIKRISDSFMKDFTSKFTLALGVKPAAKVLDDLPKALKYMRTPVSDDGEFEVTVRVFPKEWLVNPLCGDGAGFYVPRSNPTELMVQNYKLSSRSIYLNGNLLHVRGVSLSSGHLAKMTIQPITFRDASALFKPELAEYAKAALDNGEIICTSDALKGAPVGEHKVRFWYHNDAKSFNLLSEGKLVYTHLLDKIRFTKTEGLTAAIDRNINDLIGALRSSDSLVKYMLRNEKLLEDGEFNTLDFLDIVHQLQIGVPFGLNTSAHLTLLAAMRKMLKAVATVWSGTNHYFDKDGNVTFNFEQHNAIYVKGFVAIRSSLKHGEVSLPKGTMDAIRKIVSAHNLTVDQLVAMLRRAPVMETSCRKVTLLERNDNFPYICISVEDAKNIGADVDGDQVDLNLFTKNMFDFDQLNVGEVMEVKSESVDSLVDFFSPKRPAQQEGVDPRFNALYELKVGALVGVVSNFIGTVKYHFLRTGNLDQAEMSKLVLKLEHDILDSVIDAQKWALKDIVDLPEITIRARALGLSILPKGFGMLRGKTHFEKIEGCTLENLPKTIKSIAVSALDGYVPKDTSKSIADAMRAAHRAILSKHYSVASHIFTRLVSELPDAMENATFNVESHIASFPRALDLAEAMSNIYNNLFGDLDVAKGFMLNSYNRITHVFLEEFYAAMTAIRNDDSISKEDGLKMINNLKRPTFDKIIGLTKTLKGQIAMQIMLVICAWMNIGKNRGSTFSFVLNYVHPLVLRTVVEILKEDGNPEGLFFKDTIDRKYNIVAESKISATLAGDMSILPEAVRKHIEQMYDISGNQPGGTLVYISGSGDSEYSKAKEYTQFNIIHFVHQASGGTWKIREI